MACATISYIEIMPTFSDSTGKRAHLMNVYTYIAYRQIEILIDEAKNKGVTEISLDSTDLGRPLYEKLGFCPTNDCMVIN